MIDYTRRAILNVSMSKLDENLEALHRKVDAHLERLTSRRRVIAEEARTTEPASGTLGKEEDSEAVDQSGPETFPSVALHSSGGPAPPPTQPIEPIGTSTEIVSPAAEPDGEPALKPAHTADYKSPQALPVEQSLGFPESDHNAVIRPQTTDAVTNASLGFFGKIFRRLRWW